MGLWAPGRTLPMSPAPLLVEVHRRCMARVFVALLGRSKGEEQVVLLAVIVNSIASGVDCTVQPWRYSTGYRGPAPTSAVRPSCLWPCEHSMPAEARGEQLSTLRRDSCFDRSLALLLRAREALASVFRCTGARSMHRVLRPPVVLRFS